MVVCVAGKNDIAVSMLELAISGIGRQSVVVCPSRTDDGSSHWQPSLARSVAAICRTLLDRGSNRDARGQFGKSIWDYAMRRGNGSVSEFFGSSAPSTGPWLLEDLPLQLSSPPFRTRRSIAA